MHDHLVQRGLRERSRILLIMPWPTPLPVSAEIGNAFLEAFAERGIEFMPNTTVTTIESDGRALRLADGSTIATDLILSIPKHVAPKAVLDSPLVAADGWIAVDRDSLATRFTDVYAIGDVTSVGTPRAGVFAEGAAKIVAEQILARVRGSEGARRFLGDGACYVEFGAGRVGRVDVNFLGGPTPEAHLTAPSAAMRADKSEFGASRRARWFGL
jgi:sulfide:quinone oxidoreductase